MADELRVVITADASGVGPAVAQATAAVEASSDQIAAAQAKATAATKALTAAQVQLGKAAEVGGPGSSAAAIIAEYAAASSAAKAAVEQLTAAQETNTGATVANAAAQRVDTAATYNRTEAMGAARVAMGAMDGSMGMMGNGLARLAAASNQLGPILADMVPVAVIGAGVFILADLIKGVIEFSEKATDLAETLGTNWFDAAKDQLEGLSEQIKATEKDIQHFQETVDTEVEKQKQLQFQRAGLEGGPESEATAKAQNGAQDIATQRSKLDLLQKQLEVARAFSSEQDYARTHPGFLGTGTKIDGETVDYWAAMWKIPEDNYARAGQMARAFEAQIQAINAQIQTESQQTTVTIEQAFKPPKGSSDKGARVSSDNLPEQIARAQIEAAHAADADLSPQDRIVEEMNKQIALNDLNAKFSKEGTAAERERLRVLEDQIAAEKAFASLDKLGVEEQKKADAEAKKQLADAAKQQDKDLEAVDEALVKQHKGEVEAAHDKAELAIQLAALDFELSEAEIRRAEEEGRISHKVAEQKLQDAARLKQEQSIAARQEEMGTLKPGAYEGDDRAYKKMQDQMVLDAKKGALERERLAEQEAKKMEQIYKKVANEFNTDFTRAFNEWATKSQTAGQAFGRMLGEMELQIADWAAMWILKQAEMYLEQKLYSALTKQDNAQKAASAAGLAGANMTASVAAAPFPIDLSAPAEGAMAASTAASFAAATQMDNGGMMPHMGFAFNTSGSAERVLSPSQTQNFESMVNQGGSRSATLNYAPTIHGSVNEDMLREHSAKLMTQVRSMLRPEALA